MIDVVEVAGRLQAIRVLNFNAVFPSEFLATVFTTVVSEDEDYVVTKPVEVVKGEWLVTFFDITQDTPCHVCGNEMYYDPKLGQWGHAERRMIRPYCFLSEEEYVPDSPLYVRVIGAFLNRYHEVPEGMNLKEVMDHGLDECDGPCEICARRYHGCPP